MTHTSTKRVASALSTVPEAATAAAEAARRVSDDLGATPDLALAFFSMDHVESAESVARAVRDELEPVVLLGCTGESIVGGGREVEEGPALVVWAACLPGTGLEPFHARLVRTEDAAGFVGIPDLTERPDAEAVLLLGEPFSFPADPLLRWAGEHTPKLPFIGGMASGGSRAGEHRLLLDAEVHEQGAVGVLLSGEVPLRTLVSQGCRPIGPNLAVTKAEQNVIHELAGRPALEQLREVLEEADPEDRSLASFGLHVGIAADEYQDELDRGDFLIRSVVGADEDAGAIAVGDTVEVGQTVRFHVRDADSADEDLRELLGRLDGPPPEGALLFTCNGRGSRLFLTPDHDVELIRTVVGEVPVAGLFCQGEIGPVGPKSFLHGFTASAAFFG